jgi:phosphatidate cytidylyltransferase
MPATSHGKRLVTAAVIIPLLFSSLYWGGLLLFLFLVWGCLLLGNREFLTLLYHDPPPIMLWLHGLWGTLALAGAYFRGLEGLLAVLILGSILSVLQLIWTFPYQRPFFEYLGKQTFALWYLPLYLPFLILIRLQPQGLWWIFFLAAVNYAGDTAAYYVGRTWGRHKLAPSVSPQKTVEGSLGGLTANVLIALLLAQTLFPHYPWFVLSGLGLLIGIVSQLGDLLESVFKRAARIKDSGSIFPGHGGLLDRVDSLILPAPILYFFLIFFKQ